MISKVLKVSGFLLTAVVLSLILVNADANFRRSDDISFSLKAPHFYTIARAEGLSSIASVLDTTAGVAAYYRSPTAINLSTIKSLYRTIEIQTSEYVAGSMAVPDNREEYDVHVYTHISGWVLIYYLRDDPVVKLFDWENFTNTMNPTRFQLVADIIAGVLGQSSPSLTYYDFRYPNATDLLVAVEETTGSGIFTDSFQTLASNDIFYEKSWGLGAIFYGSCNSSTGNARFIVDGTEVAQVTGRSSTAVSSGYIDQTLLLPDSNHDITVYVGCYVSTTKAWGVLGVVYGAQP